MGETRTEKRRRIDLLLRPATLITERDCGMMEVRDRSAMNHTSMLAGLAVLAAVFFMATSTAAAQILCGDRTKIVNTLIENYREAQAGLGLTSRGAVIELFVAESGSWTLLVTVPDRETCVVAEGVNWNFTPVPKELEPCQ